MNNHTLERLNKAMEVMELPESELPAPFNMTIFGRIRTVYLSIEPTKFDAPTRCNTAACFAGNISLHPWFRRRGLKGVWSRDTGSLSLAASGVLRKGQIARYLGWRTGISQFFGITRLEAGELITPAASGLDSRRLQKTDNEYTITQKRVVRRLKKLIARYEGYLSDGYRVEQV